MKKILILTIAIVFSFTSCVKDGQSIGVSAGVGVGFQIGGVPISLSLGVGNGMYYPQSGYWGYNFGNTYNEIITVCYILKTPYNSESIPVFDGMGLPIGTVRCDQGVGALNNQLYLSILNWFKYNTKPCAVIVKWDPIPFTRGALWTGTIVS